MYYDRIMRIDCHMHTPLCGHAVGHPAEYAQRAAQQGIELITVTCHIPMAWDAFGGANIRMRRDQLDDYVALVGEAAQHGKDLGVEVLCGIEAEVFPDARELVQMDEILREYNFDFVLGSLHSHCWSYISWLKRHKVRDDATAVDCYFRHLRDGVQTGRYDSMSHPDVIRTYGVVSRFEPSEHEEVIREFLEALVEEDVCMEVNTSGLNKGAYKVHPDPLILDWASELGVKLTIGSDSHQPETVGQHFDQVLPMLQAKGFTELHYHRGRQRIAVALEL